MAEPVPVDVNRGWSTETPPSSKNGSYTGSKKIKGGEIYNEEDAPSITEDLRSRITAGHEELESQQVQQQMAHLFQLNMENLQAGIDNPVPKPAQLVPEKNRLSPFAAS